MSRSFFKLIENETFHLTLNLPFGNGAHLIADLDLKPDVLKSAISTRPPTGGRTNSRLVLASRPPLLAITLCNVWAN
jgi:hypothetical protein